MSIRSAGFRSAAIHNGRFKSDDARVGIKIIEGRRGAFYRILNSGKNDFDVNVGHGTSPITTLKPTFSLDIAVSSEVKIETATKVPIEGIYEFLNTDRPIRSGRFKIEMNNADRHKIIDIAHGGSGAKSAYYRILNSGDAPFEVRRRTGNALRELAPDESFDFEIATGGNRDIYVNPLTDTTLIEGIYDFLGQE